MYKVKQNIATFTLIGLQSLKVSHRVRYGNNYVEVDINFDLNDIINQIKLEQESIPVGRVPPASVATTRYQYRWGRGVGCLCPQAQVNKFEQVSSDDHQMSLAGGRYPRS